LDSRWCHWNFSLT